VSLSLDGTDDVARFYLVFRPTLNSLYTFYVWVKLWAHPFLVLRKFLAEAQADARPPPLKGTPKEAIKDTTPATMNADDEAEMEEAEEEGGLAETAIKAKHKTKEKVMGVFRSAGKKMAGFHGDVSVDGTKKKVSRGVDQ